MVTLNRWALNALTHGMILEMEKVIPQWEKDPAVKAGDPARRRRPRFLRRRRCHGLYREMKDEPEGTLRRDFFYDEYIVNRRIYRYAKPWISLIDGIDMGGGVGLSARTARIRWRARSSCSPCRRPPSACSPTSAAAIS